MLLLPNDHCPYGGGVLAHSCTVAMSAAADRGPLADLEARRDGVREAEDGIARWDAAFRRREWRLT
jgi:hypothetical protein